MNVFSKIIAKFSSVEEIAKLEEEADDVLELHGDYRLIRVKGEVVYVDDAKGKVILREPDSLPSSPARAAIEGMKRVKEIRKEPKKASSDVWTCGFRPEEQRWVWYKNCEPKVTASFEDVFKTGNIEDKFYFHSAKFGTDIIERLRTIGVKDASEEMNAVVLENPYTELQCSCGCSDNYTIDDLVTREKKASYESNFVVCSSCGNLIELK